MRHRTRIFAFIALSGVVAIGVATVVLARTDLRPLIEREASRSLGRPLKIAELRIAWGNPISVEIEGLRLANAAWGSVPQMMRIDRISAEIDLWPLLHGVVRYRKLSLTNPTLVLERDAHGVGNWRFTGAGPARASPAGGLALVPKNRSQFPSLLDFRMNGGLVTYRTSSGHVLRIDLRKLSVRAAGEDQPVRLELNGGYAGTPVDLALDGQSFTSMRNTAIPFGVSLSVRAPSSTIAFAGSVAKPLDFDGADGRLDVTARKVSELLKSFHIDAAADFPAALSGDLHHKGDAWELRNAHGKLADDKFAGRLNLREGERGQSDDVGLAFDFDRLDLNRLLASDRKGPAATADDPETWSLRLTAKPGMKIDARVTAGHVRYRKMRAAEFVVHGRSVPAGIMLSELRFGWLGGHLAASGSAHAEGDGSRLAARMSLVGADTREIAQLFDATTDQLAGRVTALASLQTAGKTVRAALRASRGSLVLAMEDGRVARSLVEKASTDLRALFRKGEGWERLTCALGILEVQSGIATLSPLRLKTPNTTLVAAGKINLWRRDVDVILRTEAGAPSAFALRLPVRISGAFDTLSARPLAGSAPESARPGAGGVVRALPPQMRQLAEQSACLR